MNGLLTRLRRRLGDFWWYTLMIFCAQRAADGLNAFVGLYLVPKYVKSDELGAVLPLTQFATFLAVPAAIFASALRQELTGLSQNREFGKIKTLLKTAFITTAIFFVGAVILSRLMLPRFLSRIRIEEGSLGYIILIAAFITAIMPVFTNSLQSLKKFTSISLISLCTAPIRLITMLALMPFRAITGYFCGQSTPPFFTILASVYSLRREFAVQAEPYWTRDIVTRFTRLFLIFTLNAVIMQATLLVESTVLRECLPAVDSAAYYLVSRFSEFSTILSSTLMLTIFPFAASISSEGRDHRPLILKCMLAASVFGGAIAILFVFAGRPIFSLLPNAGEYMPFAKTIPVAILIATVCQCANFFTTAEIAAKRFNFLRWSLPLHVAYAIVLILAKDSIGSLDVMLAVMCGFQTSRLICTLVALIRK